MTRASYKTSQETRRRLLESAGELLSRRDAAAVSLREISRRAGVALNAIAYHFGDKEGLIAAVWDYALRRWDDRRLERYLTEHEELLTSRAGRRRLVTDMIGIFYDNLYEERQPMWLNLFLFRSFLTGQETERMRRVFGVQLKEVFCALYRRITGNEDALAAVCWALTIISPGSYFTTSSTDFNTFEPVDTIDATTLRRLQETVTRNALVSVGLGEDAETNPHF